ncbi:MAG: DUF2513 domain-containing protein [Armatimonadetes bacterium]|nr:DUF2513 domain-containing protein [Armatimonadota bacterium]
MKRDMDLVRKLLLHIEENGDSKGLHSPRIVIEGFSEDEIGYNLKIMYDGGLLDVSDATSMGDRWCYYLIKGLTWQAVVYKRGEPAANRKCGTDQRADQPCVWRAGEGRRDCFEAQKTAHITNDELDFIINYDIKYRMGINGSGAAED